MSLLRAFGTAFGLSQIPLFLKFAAQNPDDFINANKIQNCVGMTTNSLTRVSPPEIPFQVETVVSNTNNGAVQWNTIQNEVFAVRDTPFSRSAVLSKTSASLSETFSWAADQFTQCTNWLVNKLASLLPEMRFAVVLGSIVVVFMSLTLAHFYSKRPAPPIAASLVQTANATDDLSCVICMHKLRTHVFVPCGHMITCGSCTNVPICPMCREPINTAVKVFCS